MTGTPIAMKPRDRILVALDTPDSMRAAALAQSLVGRVGGIKLGLEFFNANGPQGVRDVTQAARNTHPARSTLDSTPLFLDLKFHDIPNTVAGAVRSVMPLAPSILNVHAAGGLAMMTAAAETASSEAENLGIPKPMLIAVTVLTSLDDDDLSAVGQATPARDQVLRLAALTQKAGLDGVVCSSQEIEAIRAQCGPDFKLIVPGIRPAGAAMGDQKRVMTPKQAIAEGADYLVIGRPITGSDDPAAAAAAIAAELEA
jgi:orotidine-5'-phosphate decarboxylase